MIGKRDWNRMGWKERGIIFDGIFFYWIGGKKHFMIGRFLKEKKERRGKKRGRRHGNEKK